MKEHHTFLLELEVGGFQAGRDVGATYIAPQRLLDSRIKEKNVAK